MASYSTTVTKIPDLGPSPEDASSKPHHVTKNGNRVGFKNVHPSFGDGIGFSKMVRHVLWYVTISFSFSQPGCAGLTSALTTAQSHLTTITGRK